MYESLTCYSTENEVGGNSVVIFNMVNVCNRRYKNSKYSFFYDMKIPDNTSEGDKVVERLEYR